MSDIPTMFSYNALISKDDGHLILHYLNSKLLMVQSNSILKIVGSSHKYIIRPSGLAILDKTCDAQIVSPSENTNIPDDSDSPRTYYIQANMTPEGRVLDTSDFKLYKFILYNTKPLNKGTRIAVATTIKKKGLWSVPGKNNIAFVPPSSNTPGNIGEMMVTNRVRGKKKIPLWRLGDTTDNGYLFYTLTKDIQEPMYCTTG